jgi:hypothetical protein
VANCRQVANMWPPADGGGACGHQQTWVVHGHLQQRQGACGQLLMGAMCMWPPVYGGKVDVTTCRLRQGAFGHLQTEARFVPPAD